MQLEHDEEMGPNRGMYGILGADLEVQHTNKRAELTAFLSLLTRIVGSYHGSCGHQRNH